MPHPASQLLIVAVGRGKFSYLLPEKDAELLRELQPGGFVLRQEAASAPQVLAALKELPGSTLSAALDRIQ